jgi:hypothetical protein
MTAGFREQCGIKPTLQKEYRCNAVFLLHSSSMNGNNVANPYHFFAIVSTRLLVSAGLGTGEKGKQNPENK